MKIQIEKRSFRAALFACVSFVCLSTSAIAQAGKLDSTFGTGGVFSLNNGQFTDLANAVALQSDGKIVVGGEISSVAGVLRLNSQGALDSSFGTGGTVTLHLPGGDLGGNEQVIGLAIQSDGKIVTSISTENADGRPLFVLARLSANGALDTTFGTNGFIFTQPFNTLANPTVFAQQPDGKVLLAGDGAIVRYDANGQLDATFGSNGAAPLLTRSVTAIALQPNGQILLASGGPIPGGPFPAQVGFPPSAGSVARYNSNGSLDTSFGIAGQAASAVAASAVVVQSGGNIVVAGPITSRLVSGGPNQTGFGLVRYRPNGSLDTTFVKHGGLITGFPAVGGQALPLAIVLQANGDILAAGTAGSLGGSSSFALARYTGAGVLDSIFGSGGQLTTSFGNTTAGIVALALQPDGKIVAAGNLFSNGVQQAVPNIIVVRYLGQ